MSTDSAHPVRRAGSRHRAEPGGLRFGVAGPYLLVTILWLAAFPYLRHYVNPDGTSYVVVAERLLAGDWAGVANGYWGPLLSWLMAPLMAVGVPGLTALRLVLLVGALLCLAPLRSLARRSGASGVATDVLLLACAPFLVYAALFGMYPDVLLAAALLRCCAQLFRAEFPTSTTAALLAGGWGGVAYLVKAYAVPVVLVLLPLGVLVHLISTRGLSRGLLLRQGAVAMAAFAVFFAGWAGVLSAAYGEPTFSTSAGFNSRLVAPGSAGNPLNNPGLYPPPAGALSVWEEPSRLEIAQRDGGGATPATPAEGASARLDTAVDNARIVAGSVVRRGLPFALLAVAALASFAHRRQLPPPALTGTLLAGAISAGGLVLIIAIERYVWFGILACVPAAAVGLDLLLRRVPRAAPLLAAGLVAVVGATSLLGVASRWNTYREATVASAALGRLDGTVATTGAASWTPTLRLCLEVGCRYVGRPEATTADAAARELAAAGVEYLAVWSGSYEVEITDLPGPDAPAVLDLYTVTPEGLVLDRRLEGNTA